MNNVIKTSMPESYLRAWSFDLAQCAAILSVASNSDMVSGEEAVILLQTGLEKVLQIIEDVLRILGNYK